MKRTTIFTIILIIIISNLNIGYGASTRNLRGSFTEKNLAGTNLKEITFTPYYSNDDGDAERDYYIYLPSGYFIEGKSASYIADKNGRYPFTVYEGNNKKTFTYKVDSIEEALGFDDKRVVFPNYKLMYDYEKKQIFFNIQLDKVREIESPDNSITVSNEINHYIGSIDNNIPYNLSFEIDGEIFDFKIVNSGEFYLLIYLSPVNYSDYSSIVEYYGYNFTNNEVYSTYPPKDIYDDNGNYRVLVKSDNSQHLFNINISDIDYRRPSVNAEFNNDKITLKIQDDFELDYLITYDGKYVDLRGKEATYNHPEEIIYNGEYIFIVVDKEGNRTVEKLLTNSKGRINIPRRRHPIHLDVHDSKYTEEVFENKGMKYEKDNEIKLFENILPAYMNGKTSEKFSPDSSITRAEMVVIFCRLNNLPYDNSAHLKSRFTDVDNHWARDYIAMGSSKRYISGYRDRTFKPDNFVTRAEFCQMITKISSYKSLLNAIPASINNNFNDIQNHWAEKEILTITGRNLFLTTADYFYPDEPITRGEVVYAINRLYGFNPTYSELATINSLYNKYYNFQDISNHQYYTDIIISVIGMYREKID